MDRVTRLRAAVALGVVVLVAHGLAALAAVADAFDTPIEQGGLVFGPLLGLPALCAAFGLFAGAALLPTPHWRAVPLGGLFLCFGGNLFVLVNGYGLPWAAVGAAGAGTVLALLASVTEWHLRPARRDPNAPSDAITVAIMVLLAFVAVLATYARA